MRDNRHLLFFALVAGWLLSAGGMVQAGDAGQEKIDKLKEDIATLKPKAEALKTVADAALAEFEALAKAVKASETAMTKAKSAWERAKGKAKATAFTTYRTADTAYSKAKSDKKYKRADKANRKAGKAYERESKKLEKAQAKLAGLLEDAGAKLAEEADRQADLLARKADTQADEMAQKNRWIDKELDYAKALSRRNFADLGEAHLNSLLAGEIKPLDDNQKKYVESARVKLEVDLIPLLKNVAEKITKAATVMERIGANVESYEGGEKDDIMRKIMYRKYRVDQAEMYLKIAKMLARDVHKIENEHPTVAAAEAIRVAALTSATEPTTAEPATTPAAEGEPRLLQDVQLLRSKAVIFFKEGIKIANAMHEVIEEEFSDTRYAMDEAKGSKRAKLDKKLNRLWKPKSRLLRMVAEAHVEWIQLYPVLSTLRTERYKEAGDYLDFLMLDLQAFKAFSLSYLRFLGLGVDPVVQQEDGKYIAKVDDKPEGEAAPEVFYYLWRYNRMQFLHDFEFMGKYPKPNPWAKSKRPRGWKMYKALDIQKLLASYYLAQGYTNLAKTTFAVWQKQTDDEKKKRAREHLTLLMAEAENAIANVNRMTAPWSKRVKIPTPQRFSAALKFGTELELLRTRVYKTEGNDDAAMQAVGKALEYCTKIIDGAAPHAWKATAKNQLVIVQRKAEAIVGKMNGEDSLVLMRIAAKELFSSAEKELDEKKQQVKREAALAKYLKIYEKSKDEKGADPVTTANGLNRIGYLSSKLENYELGYMGFFEVVQRFQPKHYPRSRYTTLDPHFQKALTSLRFAASRYRDADGTDVGREMYIRALKLILKTGDDPDLVVSLITTLQATRQYDQALGMITEVPPTHLYYNTMQLIGASLYQKKIKKVDSALRKLPNPTDKSEEGVARLKKFTEEQLAAEPAARAALEAERKSYLAAAEKYATVFIKRVKGGIRSTRPDPKDDEDGAGKWDKVVQQELNNLPSAMMIAVNNRMATKDYAKVVELCDDVIVNVPKIKGISPEASAKHLATAHWVRFLATIKQVDGETGSVEGVAKVLTRAGELQPLLVKADLAGKHVTGSYQYLGVGWHALAIRIKGMREKEESDALKKQETHALNRAAEWMKKAEPLIYAKLSYALLIGRLFSDLGRYEDAVGSFAKAIDYWEDSQFSASHLLKRNKRVADLAADKIDPTLKAALGGLVEPDKLVASGGGEKLVDVLNGYLEKLNYRKRKDKEKFDTFLAAAQKVYGDDKKMKGVLRQVSLLQKKITEESEDPEVFRMNRYLFDLLYPKVLARGPDRSLIPGEKEYKDQIKEIRVAFALGRKESFQGNLFRYFHDAESSLGRKTKAQIKAYRKMLLKAKKKAAGAERAKLSMWISLFDTDLKTLVYGQLDQKSGKLTGRNYYAAQQYVAKLLLYYKQGMPAKVRSTMSGVKLPTELLLGDIVGAVQLEDRLSRAKKRYAWALVETGDVTGAIKYFKDLLRLKPNSRSLLLGLATVYTKAGEKIAKGGYTQASAQYFTDNRAALSELQRKNKAKPNWWKAIAAYMENEFAEVMVRRQAGKAGGKSFKTKGKFYLGKRFGWLVKEFDSGDLKKQGAEVGKSVRLMMRSVRYVTAPPDVKERFDELKVRLEKAKLWPAEVKIKEMKAPPGATRKTDAEKVEKKAVPPSE